MEKWEKKAQGRLSWGWRIVVCFFLVKNTILNLNSLEGTSDLKIIERFSIASCCIEFFFQKHKRRARKQTVGNRFEFFDFILLKETFRRKRDRFTSKKCKSDKSFISFIYLLYALPALKLILSSMSQTFFAVPYRILDTEWLSSI